MFSLTKKYLSWGKLRVAGRNNQNNIVCYHRGGGAKKKYIFIDFFNYIWNVYGIIFSVIYYNKSFLNLIVFLNGFFIYRFSIQKLKIGDFIFSSTFSFLLNSNGFIFFIKNIPTGLFISNLEILPFKKSQYVRSSGTFARIIASNNIYCLVRLKSYYIIKILINCICILGKLLNKNQNIKWKKASYYFYQGWRPVVRGVAMNPIDHPHGGGQGKTSGGRPSCSPWAWYTKGKKTRQLNKRRNYMYTKYLQKYGKV